jgi:hypothetical protein
MKTQSALRDSCRLALAAGLRRANPDVDVDSQGYVSDIRANLLATVRSDDFMADVEQGSGNELVAKGSRKAKFCAAHSSSALAVNTFGPFKRDVAALRIGDWTGFSTLSFERKCPHGLPAPATPPNLDVLAESRDTIVAIESKCLEPLMPKIAAFKPAYESAITDRRRQGVWFKQMQWSIENPASFRCLDVAQLVKHAFGLAYTFPLRPVTLLYLFWEPANADAHPFFAVHRAEVARLAASVATGTPAFAAMSYPELWAAWSSQSEPDWLRAHVAHLRTRYFSPV